MRNKIMPTNQPHRIALITGSNRGIGLETAQQLANRGFHVVIAARDKAGSQQAIKKIQAAGGKATFLQLDVSNSTSIHSAASSFTKISDHLDVLINNAGIY